MHLNIPIIDNSNTQKDDLKQIMQRAISSGQIAETMKNAWNLRGVPMISNLNCWTKSSKRKMKEPGVMLVDVIDDDNKVPKIQMGDVKQSDSDNEQDQNEGQQLIDKQKSVVSE